MCLNARQRSIELKRKKKKQHRTFHKLSLMSSPVELDFYCILIKDKDCHLFKNLEYNLQVFIVNRQQAQHWDRLFKTNHYVPNMVQ